MVDLPTPASPIPATPTAIAALRGVPASMKAAAMLCLGLKGGGLRVDFPGGPNLGFGEADQPLQAHIIVHDPRFARRILERGDLGVAESYIDGDWSTPDLSAMLTLFSQNGDRLARFVKGNPLARLGPLIAHFRRDNTREGSRRNILAHYDLGNRFYERWLDGTMTYSSALFARGGESLEEAQLAKYRALAAAIDLKPGEHVLEIGCGWGGFAEFAAKEYGARVTGLTLSDAQHAFACARMQRQGLAERVDIRIEDYRDVSGSFDKIASIEMFEAVGERHWPSYFAKVAQVLKPGGRAGLQIITIEDRLFPAYRRRADFIQRYIFPGGMLPSVSRLREEIARAGLSMGAPKAFAASYAETLAEWGRRFHSAWDDIRELGFDERFARLWRFYLSYCEAGFRTGRTDVIQVALAKR